MNSAVCTLFEGSYHYGLAALVNSLYANGYRGSLYAGFRGTLPEWASSAQKSEVLNWKGGKTITINDDFQIWFLPLETDYHLTNYKPNFILELLEKLISEPTKFFYFDPDIVLISKWQFFEEWLETCDVALFEDVNSPLGKYHPKRMAWRNYFGALGVPLEYKDSTYANGGFLGLNIECSDFLITWKKIQEMMAPAIGGLNRSSISGTPITTEANTPFAPFKKTDQDALNATVEAWTGIFSFIGKEGMAIEPGEAIIPHALGRYKPWQSQSILRALSGFPPSKAEKAYWQFSKGVISAHTRIGVFYNVIGQKIASLLGRFYRRN